VLVLVRGRRSSSASLHCLCLPECLQASFLAPSWRENPPAAPNSTKRKGIPAATLENQREIERCPRSRRENFRSRGDPVERKNTNTQPTLPPSRLSKDSIMEASMMLAPQKPST